MENAAASTSCGDVVTGCTRDYTSEFKMTQIFKSRKDLIEWACKVGRSNGFVIVTLRSDSGEGKKRARVTLGCERSGKSDMRIPRKEIKNKDRRQTGTKKCGCPFRLMGKKNLATDDDWELIVVVGVHNHAVGHLEEGHSFAGRLSQEEKSLLKDMTLSLVQPKEILSTLKRRDEHNKSTLRTIYNARQLCKAESKKFDMQQWMNRLSKLSEYNHIHWHRSCPKTDTRDFFLTHPISLDLLHAFPCVLLITSKNVFDTDCELNIVGVTSTDIQFSIGYVYLSSERRDNLLWALNTLRGEMDGVTMPRVIVTDKHLALMKAIEDVFGTTELLLFTEEIYWDVLGNCSRSLLDSYGKRDCFLRQWKILVQSPTFATFGIELMLMHLNFSMYPEALAYVTNTWLNPYKEKFVAAWTDKYMHFGTSAWNKLGRLRTNFQVQLTKRFWYLPLQGDRRVLPDEEEFDYLLEEMQSALESEHIEIKASFEKSLAAVEIDDFRIPELKELVGVVSTSALTSVLAQCRQACDVINVECSVCGCVIRRTHGLPCHHEIAKYKRDGRPIPVECIDPHWKKLSMPPLRNTAESGVDETMKRRRLNKNDASTPSALPLFEVAESAEGNSLELEEKVYHNQSTKLLEFVDAFPAILRPYLFDVKDVASDGHCGFRAIASLLGYSGEDGWVKVRKDLINELKFNALHYAQLFGSDKRVNELLHALNYFGSTCLDHKEHWMTMPDMGHIIASCYNVILMHMSSVQYFTFFPLRTVPISASSPIEIAIGFINDHFVQVLLEPGHPMPPIASALTKKWKNMPPIATDWERFHKQRCTEWANRYNARIDYFKSLHPEVVLQKNPILIDND